MLMNGSAFAMASDTEEIPGIRIANPNALGFGVFAILAWTYGMIYAGWFPDATGTVTALDTAILGTYALLVAAIASFLRGETWHAVFFMFWSGLAWGLKIQTGETGPEAFLGWSFLTIAVFHFLLAWGAFQRRELGRGRTLVALGEGLVFLSFALAGWGLSKVFWVLGGYVALLTALVAFWITAQEIGVAGEAA